MTLYEMLDVALTSGKVLIYTSNAYDQCMKLFQGTVSDARRDDDLVWDYLMNPVETWVCGNGWTLIYVKDNNYEDRLEKHCFGSEKWTKECHPYKNSYEVNTELKMLH